MVHVHGDGGSMVHGPSSVKIFAGAFGPAPLPPRLKFLLIPSYKISNSILFSNFVLIS
jgi:hypothetical protein